MNEVSERYVPAAGRAAFTGLYDRVVAATMREDEWRPRLVAVVAEGLGPGATVVDVGAGTGAVSLRLARELPDAQVVAVDGDPAALAIARGKPGADRIAWHAARAEELPLGDGAADRVVMSLLLHHLAPASKRAALLEARRVLRPGGSLHVADWGRPVGAVPRVVFAALRLLDGRAGTRDHAKGRLPEVLREAGLGSVRVHHVVRLPWGTLELLRAAPTALAADRHHRTAP